MIQGRFFCMWRGQSIPSQAKVRFIPNYFTRNHFSSRVIQEKEKSFDSLSFQRRLPFGGLSSPHSQVSLRFPLAHAWQVPA
jgi:hypothetical protein